jgi:hypothetical protein
MRSPVIAALAFLLTMPCAHAASVEVPKNLQDRWLGHSMTLALAEACSRKQGRPEIFDNAIKAFVKFAHDNRIAGAEAAIRESARKAANSASDGDMSLMMATPDSCRKIEAGSRKDLKR